MSARIAVIAALPREIAALARGTAADPKLLKRGIHLYRLEGAVIAAAGMGAERAALAVEAALATGNVKTLVSAGLAGGCTPEALAGSALEADMVVDARTGERFRALGAGGDITLATTDTIASVREKAWLAASYGAMLVDMEAATVARIAQAHGLAFRAIKGVSDAHEFELSSLAKFAGKRGSFRTGAFALHTALRPWEWAKAMELGRGSTRALAQLNAALQQAIRE